MSTDTSRRRAPYKFEKMVERVPLLHELVHSDGVGEILDLLQPDEVFEATPAAGQLDSSRHHE
jgi:hypothetical protein